MCGRGDHEFLIMLTFRLQNAHVMHLVDALDADNDAGVCFRRPQQKPARRAAVQHPVRLVFFCEKERGEESGRE